MEKLLKPPRLSIDPNSPSAGKEWKHWVRRFESYASHFAKSMSNEEADAYRLNALVNYADTEIYGYFDHCETYEEAEGILQELYVKEPSEIFARYILRMAQQKPSQTLSDFRCTLNKLAKDCSFSNLTAAQHKDLMVRDAFIAGLSSPEIRQRLLEHKTLTYSEAYRLAVTFDDAKRNNLEFSHPNSSFGATSSMAANAINTPPIDNVNVDQSASATGRVSGVCIHCGGSRTHDFKNCKAKSVICYNCGKKGHFSRACQSKKNSSFSGNRSKHVATVEQNDCSLSCTEMSTSVVEGRNPVITYAVINNRRYNALLDTGSFKCFIDKSIAVNFNIERAPPFRVGLAQATNKVTISGVCNVNLKVLGNVYKNVKLYVMNNLCGDILLGREFLNLHKNVIFRFNGLRGDLEVPEFSVGAVKPADIKTPSLFANLRNGWRPIATKSRRFNKRDLEFINMTVSKWEKSGTIRPSNSPWRAQCVVVKSGKQIVRLAIDYS